MKNKHRKNRKKCEAQKRFRRLPVLIVICAGVFLAIGAITVISKQRAAAKQSVAGPNVLAAQKTSGNFVTVKVGGHDVQVDTQTGQIKPLSPQEAQQLAEGLKKMLNRSTEGLVPVRQADGSVYIDLQGRFQNVAVARVNPDGSIEQSCVDNPEAAAKFFGIDPQLVGAPQTNQPAKPVETKPIQ
jgi:hypothetical protein